MASDLGLHCLGMSHKKDARLIRVKTLCMSLYHEQCVGVAKDEPVGVWLCLSYPKVPQGTHRDYKVAYTLFHQT